MEYLKWKNIDLENGMIEIAGSRTSANEEIIRDTTKTGHTRETSVSAKLINVLSQYREKAKEAKLVEHLKANPLLKRKKWREYLKHSPGGRTYTVLSLLFCPKVLQ